MKKIITGLLLAFMSTSLFANLDDNGYIEALKRRDLFKEATQPIDSDLNLNEYLNCISYDLRDGKKKIALAAEFFKKKSSNSYYSRGLGGSKFSSSGYKLSKVGLSAKTKEGEDTHIKTFRVTFDGFLLLEVATTRRIDLKKDFPTSLVSNEYKAILYGACEFNYKVDIGNINDYEILEL